MHIRLTTLVGVALAAVASASLAFGSAQSSSQGRTINAIGQAVGFASIDANRDGKRTVGDYEIGQTVFLSAKTGKPLGRGTVICTMLNTGGTIFQCQGQVRFPGGDVVHAGLFKVTSKTYRTAIVGGTGAYEGVSGTVSGTWLDARFLRQKVVFSLHS